MSRRAQTIAGMKPAQLDAMARSLGFPGAQALDGMLRIGAKLQRHATLDQSDIRLLCQAYPSIDKDFLGRYVEQINALPADARAQRFVEIAAGAEHAEMAHGMVSEYTRASDSADLDARLSERDAAPTEHRIDPTSVRALVEKQIPRSGVEAVQRRFARGSDPERRELAATVLETSASRRSQMHDDSSLRDQVRQAYFEHDADDMYSDVMEDSTEDLIDAQ